MLNKRADKAAVFAGWREMNDYMRDNKIEPVAPQCVADAAADVADATGRRSRASDPAREGRSEDS